MVLFDFIFSCLRVRILDLGSRAEFPVPPWPCFMRYRIHVSRKLVFLTTWHSSSSTQLYNKKLWRSWQHRSSIFEELALVERKNLKKWCKERVLYCIVICGWKSYVKKISRPNSFDFFEFSDFWTRMYSLSVRKTSSFVGDQSYCFVAIE